MRKLCSKWVLCLLIVKHNQQHDNDSERCLQLFQHNKKEFLFKYVTMDKTWIRHFIQESYHQSVEWTAVVESHSKQPRHKYQQARFRPPYFKMCKLFGFIDYHEKGRTINSEYYIALLVHLKEEITKKRPQMKKKNVLFHQDNAPCHKSITTTAKLHEFYFERHTPYS